MLGYDKLGQDHGSWKISKVSKHLHSFRCAPEVWWRLGSMVIPTWCSRTCACGAQCAQPIPEVRMQTSDSRILASSTVVLGPARFVWECQNGPWQTIANSNLFVLHCIAFGSVRDWHQACNVSAWESWTNMPTCSLAESETTCTSHAVLADNQYWRGRGVTFRFRYCF